MTAKVGLWEHFRKLARFGGREDRASFWPYAALVFAIVMVAGSVMAIPLTIRSIGAAQEMNFQDLDPGAINASYGLDEFAPAPQVGVPGPIPFPGFIAAYSALTYGLAVALYAAAVVRRLHDRGKSGAWGLMPLPFILYSTLQVPRLVGAMSRGGPPDMTLFLTLAFSNLFQWIAIGALVVLLVGASEPGPNAYDLRE